MIFSLSLSLSLKNNWKVVENFGYNLAELRARDTLNYVYLDIMGENVKKNAIFLPLLSFFFKLFTFPVSKCACYLVISKCTNVFKIATFGNIYGSTP